MCVCVCWGSKRIGRQTEDPAGHHNSLNTAERHHYISPEAGRADIPTAHLSFDDFSLFPFLSFSLIYCFGEKNITVCSVQPHYLQVFTCLWVYFCPDFVTFYPKNVQWLLMAMSPLFSAVTLP